MTRISILGAGPHGREIAWDLVRLPHVQPVLHDDFKPGYDPIYQAFSPYVIGAVWPDVRRQIADRVTGLEPWRADGHVVFPGVQLGRDVEWGQHVHVLHNAVISHGCRLGDFVTVCAGAVLCGEVTVGDGAVIGANATVIHGGISIGEGAFVGAGAVVLEDVPAGATVVGVPASEKVAL